MKTSELSGVALDWAVAKAEGKECNYIPYTKSVMVEPCGVPYFPSSDWSQGGPIIEKSLMWFYRGLAEIKAYVNYDTFTGKFCIVSDSHKGRYRFCSMKGQTILEAAMRCYVAAKLGDEIELPEELK